LYGKVIEIDGYMILIISICLVG